jgi:phage shock protein A
MLGVSERRIGWIKGAQSMGILGRINRVIKSNMNELIDKMTDPAKEVEQLIIDMEASVKKAKEEVIAGAATAKRSEKRMEELRGECGQWQARAEQAVKAGDDDLAREALKRKMTVDEQFEDVQRVHAEQSGYVAELKDSLRQLEARVQDIKLRKESIKQKAKAAKEGSTGLAKGKAFAEFDRLEDRIETIEASAALDSELDGRRAETDAKFARLERETGKPEIEDELAALKRKMDLE